MNTSLNEAFWDRHFDKIDWYEMSANTGRSVQFMERHIAKPNIDRMIILSGNDFGLGYDSEDDDSD